MTLFERLRDAPAVCMIPQQGGVGTPTVGLTERERAAVLNLIEAAQHYREVVERMVATQDPAELKPAWQRFTDAHDVFVSASHSCFSEQGTAY